MSDNIFTPARFASESQEEYRIRQKTVKHELKVQKYGKAFWDSSRGTYIKAK